MSYSIEEKTRIFRYHLRKYQRYVARLISLQEKLGRVENKLEPQSPRLDRIRKNIKKNVSHDAKLINIIALIDTLEVQIDYYQQKLDWVDSCLDSMPYGSEKVLIVEKYMIRDPCEHIFSLSQEKRQIRAYLEQYLTDEMFELYDALPDKPAKARKPADDKNTERYLDESINRTHTE